MRVLAARKPRHHRRTGSSKVVSWDKEGAGERFNEKNPGSHLYLASPVTPRPTGSGSRRKRNPSPKTPSGKETWSRPSSDRFGDVSSHLFQDSKGSPGPGEYSVRTAYAEKDPEGCTFAA